MAEVKDAVATVQGVINGHDTKLNIAKDVIDKSQAEIVELSQKVQSTHGDIISVKGLVSEMHGAVAEAQDAVSVVKGAVSGHDA